MTCYFHYLDQIGRQLISSLKSRLPKEVVHEAEKYVSDHDKTNFLLGRILVAKALIKQGSRLTLRKLKYSKWDKPYFNEGPEFSISHSRNLVAVVVAEKFPVGIDVQYCKPADYTQYFDLLNQHDLDVINHSKEPLTTFYEIWTKKESISKADGRGLSIDFQHINLENGCGWIASDPKPEKWKTRTIHLHDMYIANISSIDLPETIRILPISTD